VILLWRTNEESAIFHPCNNHTDFYSKGCATRGMDVKKLFLHKNFNWNCTVICAKQNWRRPCFSESIWGKHSKMELFSRCLRRLNYPCSTNCYHLKIVEDVCKCIQRLPAKLKYSEEKVQQQSSKVLKKHPTKRNKTTTCWQPKEY